MGVSDFANFDLGARIRSIRKAKKMTIKEVAARAGVTIGLISQIERNLANPSVKSLAKIADVLGVPIATLFSRYPRHPGPVVRKGERRYLGSPAPGVTYSLLTPDFNRAIEVVYGVYQPGATSGELLFAHAGEECCYVLEGKMKLILDDEVYFIEEGDTVSFAAMLPHQVENVGDELLRALWIITPPPF